MSDRLPTHVHISAAIRHAEDAGAQIVVIHKGEADRGAVLIKTNNLAGQYALHQQVFDGERTRFIEHIAATGDEAKVSAEVARMHNIDPDCWVIEIEDRQARLWLDAI